MAALVVFWATLPIDDPPTESHQPEGASRVRAVQAPSDEVPSAPTRSEVTAPETTHTIGIAGRVVVGATHSPVTGAAVTVLGVSGQELGHGTSDEEGTFSLELTQNESWARVIGHRPDLGQGTVRRSKGMDDRHLIVPLLPESVLGGRVRMKSNDPLPRPVRVQAWDNDDPNPTRTQKLHGALPQKSAQVYEATTDADGLFELIVPSRGTYRLQAGGGGLVMWDALGLDQTVRSSIYSVAAGTRNILIEMGVAYVLDALVVDETGSALDAAASGVYCMPALAVKSYPDTLAPSYWGVLSAQLALDMTRLPGESSCRVSKLYVSETDLGDSVGPLIVAGAVSGVGAIETQVMAVRGDLYTGPQRLSTRRATTTGSVLIAIDQYDTAWWEDLAEEMWPAEPHVLGRVHMDRIDVRSELNCQSIMFFLEANIEPQRFIGIQEGVYRMSLDDGIARARSEQLITIRSEKETEWVCSIGVNGGLLLDATFKRDGMDVACDSSMIVSLNGPRPSNIYWSMYLNEPPYLILGIKPGEYKLKCEHLGRSASLSTVHVRASGVARESISFM